MPLSVRRSESASSCSVLSYDCKSKQGVSDSVPLLLLAGC